MKGNDSKKIPVHNMMQQPKIIRFAFNFIESMKLFKLPVFFISKMQIVNSYHLNS